jgi:hypothetical protein
MKFEPLLSIRSEMEQYCWMGGGVSIFLACLGLVGLAALL